MTDSYPICIHTQSVCILICALAWSIEYLVEFLNSRRRTADAAQVAQDAPTTTTATPAAAQDVKL